MGKNKTTFDESDPEQLKEAGNKAYRAKNYEEAIAFYSKAIDLKPTNHIYYSNSK